MSAGDVERSLELLVDSEGMDEVGFGSVVVAEDGGEMAEVVRDRA